jgi:formaldehyde-activating enzyme involved in methanogenesis
MIFACIPWSVVRAVVDVVSKGLLEPEQAGQYSVQATGSTAIESQFDSW